MTLPVGTTLQNGRYVIDAFCYEDSLGPTYLATQVTTGEVVQIKILGSQRPDQIPGPEVRSHFQTYLQQVNQLKSSHLPSPLESFEEEGIFYLAMAADLGQPLATRATPQTPLSPRQALQVVQHLRQILETLRPLGWQGLLLQPDQLWLNNRRLVLTGFGFPNEPPAPPTDEAPIVTQTAQLLFFLLTGERVEQTGQPLVHLRQQCPGLPSGFETAVAQGLAASPQDGRPALTLAMWHDLLPEKVAPAPAVRTHAVNQASPPSAHLPSPAAPTGPVKGAQEPPVTAVAPPSAKTPFVTAGPDTAKPSRTPFWLTPQAGLLMTGLVASVAGLGFGLTLRVHGPVGPSGSSLNPEQSFPPLPDWSGDDPVAEFDTPYLPDEPKDRPATEAPRRNRPLVAEPIETPFERPTVPAADVSPGYARDSSATDPDQPPVDGVDSAAPAPQPPSMADPLPQDSGAGPGSSGDAPPPPAAPPAPIDVPPAAPNPAPASSSEPPANLSRPAPVIEAPAPGSLP